MHLLLSRGDYRYLTDGSAIGIHQFRFDTGFNPAETAIVGQQLLGKVFDFVKRSRVDTSLFALMISISADRVYVFSREELNKFRIVTGDVFSERWTFEMKDDVSYLKGTQLTSRGRNKVILTGPPGKNGRSPCMTFLSQLPSREEVIRRTKRVILFIDDVASPVPPARVAGPHLQGGDYIGGV